MGLIGHGLFRGLDISGSAMGAERTRLNVIAANIANAEVTRTPEGGPYRRKVVTFEPILQDVLRNTDPSSEFAKGVKVKSISTDQSPFQKIYKKGHPDADENGMVEMPNVNLTFEMIDLMTALRAYEANLHAAKKFTEMTDQVIQMGR